jgi:hypothetical protein
MFLKSTTKAGKTKKPKLCAAKWTFVWYEPKIRKNELARNPSGLRSFMRFQSTSISGENKKAQTLRSKVDFCLE